MRPALARHGALAACLLALLAAVVRQPAPPADSFAPPPEQRHTALPAEVARETLPGFGRATGGASLALLTDGRVAAAWRAARPDGSDALWFSLRSPAGWQPPVIAALRESSAAGSFARVGALGRPWLQVEGGWLSLWYPASVIGDATAGALFRGQSTHAGADWDNARRRVAGPLAARAPQLAAPPVVMADGGLRFAAASESGGSGVWLNLDRDGRVVGRQAAERPLRAFAVRDAQQALALAGENDRLLAQRSTDGGRHWHTAGTLPGAAGDRPAALLFLADGRCLAVAEVQGERALQAWLSRDHGETWQAARRLDEAADGAAEFSQPALVQARDGRITLAYTWRQQGIRILRFTPAWLTEDPA